MSRPKGWKPACIALLFLAATAITAPAQTFTNLISFNAANGAQPKATLAQGLDGKLYGTVSEGLRGGGGTFKITTGGTLTSLHSFCVKTCADGFGPNSALVQATNTGMYGTTPSEGDLCSYCGTVFDMTTAGTVVTMHSFSAGVDGAGPQAGVVQASNSNFYGTTVEGAGFGYGTVFEMTPRGTLTALHAFTGGADGKSPYAGLVQGTDGNFYGTTSAGGANGYGTVFKITPAGTLSTLHSFTGNDGSNSQATLVQGKDGNFYGVTTNGGASTTCTMGCGTVFKITPAGVLTVLHSFHGADGANPQGSLLQATDGNFYGTTSPTDQNFDCASNGCGTIFKITSGGTLTALHSFAGFDGAYPVAGLMQATNGTLYGTASRGGTPCGNGGCGTVYSLSMGLAAFVKTVPTSNRVGGRVIILGTDLTGTTSVTFNGTAATFAVVSATEITTTVPAGASTGTVKLTTPSGTLSSNVAFRVF